MSQSIVGGWKPLWPRQSLPVYDDRPLQILDRLSSEGKRKLFTHHSVNSTCNYEELEWVGDAALELLARRMISRRYPQLKLGEKSVSRRCGFFCPDSVPTVVTTVETRSDGSTRHRTLSNRPLDRAGQAHSLPSR